MIPRLGNRYVQQSFRRLSTNTTKILSSRTSFRPRRRMNPAYRPLKPLNPNPRGAAPRKELPESIAAATADNDDEDEDFYSLENLETHLGSEIIDRVRESQRTKRLDGKEVTTDEYLRMADYMTAEAGSLEEMRLERSGLAMDAWDEEDRQSFLKEVDEKIEELRWKEFNIDEVNEPTIQDDDENKHPAFKKIQERIREVENIVDSTGEPVDPLRLAYGQWGETIIRVDRVQKVQRGGTRVLYRALVIGGNARGCAGFGVGKALTPQEATAIASRQCKRNIFFVDRHAGGGLIRNLAGKHNSCKVMLFAVSPEYGLHGHPLICDILLYFGISDCTAKSHGNRNQFNIVQATFKALMTNESMDEVARRRGKRLMSLERAHDLEI